MSNPTEIGGQEPSEPPSAEPPSAETAEEENPAIAAFNSWGGEGSPPPPGFAHAPPAAGMPARRRTIGRIGQVYVYIYPLTKIRPGMAGEFCSYAGHVWKHRNLSTDAGGSISTLIYLSK